MSRTSCKVCASLPNPVLEQMLATKSTRFVATHLGIGKTTVSEHNRLCAGKPASEKIMDSNELQSIEWNGDNGVFKTGAIDQVLSDRTPDDIIAMFGHDPQTVKIKGVIWERHEQKANGDWKHRYSFAIIRNAEVAPEAIDPIQILESLGTKPRVGDKNNGVPSTFVLDWADWQYAKKEGGGTVGLIERVNSAINSAVDRILELRTIGRQLDELVIIGGGDMVEGCVIYPNQSYEIDGNRREQIRGTVALILHGITTLAPYFKSVRVVVAPGNHGEHRINGNRTTIGDNDDLLVFEMAGVACSHNENLNHVSFEIAEKELSVTTDIQGWTYGITHGDVYGKSGGTGVRNKVFNWFRTMAANRHPIGSSDVLVTHHFHHDAMEDWGLTLWLQNPTMDGGSHYFKEYSGHDTRHGMNSWVVTKSERLQDKQILR